MGSDLTDEKFTPADLFLWFDDIGKICSSIEPNYEKQHFDSDSKIFMIKSEFENLTVEILQYLSKEFSEFTLDEARIIGEKILKFVYISGVTSFKLALKEVLGRFNIILIPKYIQMYEKLQHKIDDYKK